jgi:hypothetical protein
MARSGGKRRSFVVEVDNRKNKSQKRRAIYPEKAPEEVFKRRFGKVNAEFQRVKSQTRK